MKHNRFISLLLTVVFLFMYNTSYARAAEIKMINGVISLWLQSLTARN